MDSSRIGFGTSGRHRYDAAVKDRTGSRTSLMRSSAMVDDFKNYRSKSVQSSRLGFSAPQAAPKRRESLQKRENFFYSTLRGSNV
jgi:hypothetical protein